MTATAHCRQCSRSVLSYGPRLSLKIQQIFTSVKDDPQEMVGELCKPTKRELTSPQGSARLKGQ